MLLKLGEVFSSGMVLQREMPVAIWGSAVPGDEVTVWIRDQKATTRTNEEGKWSLTLEPMPASRREIMLISTKREELVLDEVQIGEVWIAGGQSNMEFFMRYDQDRVRELSKCAEGREIRFFDYPEIANEELRSEDYSRFAYWRPCKQDHLDYFSAVGYYFASGLEAELDVPIGIIGCNCGGTRAACWMDEETLKKYGPEWQALYNRELAAIPDLQAAKEKYMNGPMSWKSSPFTHPIQNRMFIGGTQEELMACFQKLDAAGGQVIGPWHEWRPCGLYHTMLEHIMPYTVRGVIWYQGESDELIPHKYRDMLEGLIGLWRRKWNYELPFLMVQLAPLGGAEQYPVLRSQQQLAADTIPGVWLASSSDVGNEYDVHPKEKGPVGTRLALLALGHIYGRDILCEAPCPDRSAAQRRGSSIVIPMLYCEDGLKLRGDHLRELRVYANDRELKCEAELLGSSIMIRLPDAEAKTKHLSVRFCETPFYRCNLFNMAEIPAKPFTIEF